MMLSLERAVRVYRALVESPVKVDSSTVASWPHLERALAHDKPLLTEMLSLPESARSRVQAYVSEFTPLEESRPVYQFPSTREATTFVNEVTKLGGNASHLDGGGLVAASTPDFVATEALVAELGGVEYVGPSLGEHFDYVDRQLPEALFIESGLDASLCESALLDSIRGKAKALDLNESMFSGIKSDGPLARFQTRIDTFAQPKLVLGVPKPLAEGMSEMVKLVSKLNEREKAELLKIIEGDDWRAQQKIVDIIRRTINPSGYAESVDSVRGVLMEAGGPPNAVGNGGDAEGGGPSDRGGIAKDQPDARTGSPANSRSNEQQPQQPPTEHVPSQEQGGAGNAIRLPDGTEVPFDTMKQAFAKMLHNMATQVEQGTMGGQPTPRGADQADATGTEPPDPSVAQQQVAAQSASQQDAGNGAEPPAQPAQTTGEPAAVPPQDGNGEAPQSNAAPPQNGEQPPAQPGQPPQPDAQQPPAQGDPAVEDALSKAEAGDQEALKQAQGMQGQMTDEQKQRLQALLGAQQGGNGNGAATQAESIIESLDANTYGTIHEALTKKDFIRVAQIIRNLDLSQSDKAKVALKFVAWFSEENRRFDASRFLSAAGVNESMSEAKMTKAGQDFVSGKIRKHKDGGKSQDQAVAIALSQADKAGYKGAKKNESVIQENLRDALRLMDSAREKDMVAGIGLVREDGLKNQPSKLVERVLDRLNVLAGHSSRPVREAAMAALGALYESETGGTDENIVPIMMAARGQQGYAGTSGGSGAKRGGEGIFGSIKRALGGGKQSKAMDMQEWHREQQRRREEMNAARKAYAKKANESCTVWVLSEMTPAVRLPEGLAYQGGACDPGDCVALVEAGDDTSLVRTPSGDIVRVSNNHLAMEGSGFVRGDLVEAADLADIFEATTADRLVLVVGPPHSGKGFFINETIGPSVAAGAALPRHLKVEAPWQDIQERTAREDFERLLREAEGVEEQFDRALMSPRFRYVTESGHEFLRDSVDWESFRRCGAAAARINVEEGFRRFYSQPKVRTYYESMRGDVQSATARVFRDRKSEAIIEAGKALIVDATPETDLRRFVEHAHDQGMGIDLVEFITPLSMSLSRTDLRESAVRKACNAVARMVEEVVDEGGVDQHTRYIWHGNEHSGRFTAVEGKIEKNQIAREKGNTDGKDAPAPKVRKDIVVRESLGESFGGFFTPAQRRQNVEDFKRDFPAHAHLVEQLDTGQAAESESCATGMQEAGKLLADARAAIFKLTTSTLVQCSSMAQATGMTKTQSALEQAQQQGADFLDGLKAMGDLIQKANETMKAENGGMGGDNVDAIKQQAQAMANGNGNGAAPAPAPAAPAAEPAAPPAAPPPGDAAVGEAISKVLGTPLVEDIRNGGHYRDLNESLMSYCPTLDVRQRIQVIDRIKAMVSLPEDARLRVGFSAADHRLLSEAAVFGSVAAGLVDRTSGGRNVLASPGEIHEAIKALRRRGGAMHAHLAETLERAIKQAKLNEDRARAKSWAMPFSDKGPFKLNVAKISLAQALDFAESTYERFGMNVYDDLPDLAENFRALKAKMRHAYPIPRQEMPVIEPKKGDIEAFVRDLEAGRVDIFEPWASEHIHNLFPWERSGNPPLRLGDDEWITLGIKDGDPDDDRLPLGKVRPVSVAKLKPIQDQIWFDKLIATILAFGPPGPGSFVTTKGVAIVSKDNYILDGHHRFGQIMLANPRLPMQALVVPIPHMKLLDITRSYGTARGNKAKA